MIVRKEISPWTDNVLRVYRCNLQNLGPFLGLSSSNKKKSALLLPSQLFQTSIPPYLFNICGSEFSINSTNGRVLDSCYLQQVLR